MWQAIGLKAIKATVGALPKVFKGSGKNKKVYIEVLAMLYEILAKVRKEGLMSIENDIENPDNSPIFAKYPAFVHDHHAVEFLTDYLRMMVGGNLNAFELENLMDIEIETHHHEAQPGASHHFQGGRCDAGFRYCGGGDGGCERDGLGG